MNIIIWLFMGGLIGWIASIIMGSGARQGLIADVFVGIVGAVIGGWMIAPLIGVGSFDSFNESFTAMNFVVSLIGALLLLIVLSLFRRKSTRRSSNARSGRRSRLGRQI